MISHPRLTIASFSGALLFVYSQWYALAPVIARNVYGGAGVFGLLEAVAGAGAVIGALTGIKWKPERPLRAGLMMVMAWPLENGLFALGAPLPLVAVCSFATGFGFALLIIWWETALARHIPAHALSRVSAYDWMGSAALLPVGYLVAGPLASVFGARTVLGAGSVIGLVIRSRSSRNRRASSAMAAQPSRPQARSAMGPQPSKSRARSA